MDEFINLLSDFILQEDKAMLSEPITEQKFKWASNNMAHNKRPGPDGFSIKFYQHFWYLIGKEFTSMIQ